MGEGPVFVQLRRWMLAAALSSGLSVSVWAQAVEPAGQIPAAQIPAAPACEGCLTIPALTPVTVQVVPALGSRISKTGEMFEIRLSEPIMLDGRAAVPAGAKGMGEVVHAKKPGGSGAGGELVLAARYLEVDGQRLPLRSMHLSSKGKDQTVLAAAAAQAISIFAMAIEGKDTTVAAGTAAVAKTAAAFAVKPAVEAPPPAAAAAPPQAVQPSLPATSDPAPVPSKPA